MKTISVMKVIFQWRLFHKDLENWIFDGTYEVDMTGVADPATGLIPDNINSYR